MVIDPTPTEKCLRAEADKISVDVTEQSTKKQFLKSITVKTVVRVGLDRQSTYRYLPPERSYFEESNKSVFKSSTTVSKNFS